MNPTLTQQFPRVDLSHTPTPIESLKNLSQHIGSANIWVKRDDCTGLAMGGNKARQLEFYLGDALRQSADVIMTSGAIQSNQVRMTIAAANKLGLDVEVVMEHQVANQTDAYQHSGNVLLDQIMGGTIHYFPNKDYPSSKEDFLQQRADALKAQHKKAYIIDLNHETKPIGALGYVDCAEEISQQMQDNQLHFDAIIVASGSGTTHAGLLTGLRALGHELPVYGICVRRSAAEQYQRLLNKTAKLESMLGKNGLIREQDILLDDTLLAPGYGYYNDAVIEAIHLTAQTESLLLEPVYTGKTMAHLIAAVRSGFFTDDANILFIHTGGLASVFAFPELTARSKTSD